MSLTSYTLSTQMMKHLFKFNFLPDRETFKHAARLFLAEFEGLIPNAAMKHLKEHYLDPDRPELLGGRCLGRQGMPGSNNGGERWGGHTKGSHRSVTLGYSKDQKMNPLYHIEALVSRLQTRSSSSFASSPIETPDSWSLIRKLANWKPGQPLPAMEIEHVQCHNKDGESVNLRDMIGKGATDDYSVFVPSSTLLYTMARKMKLENAHLLSTATFAEQLSLGGDDSDSDVTSTDHNVWRRKLSCLSPEEKITLYAMLEEGLKGHTVEPKQNEDLTAYLNRCCQRLPDLKKSTRLFNDEEYADAVFGRSRRGKNSRKNKGKGRQSSFQTIQQRKKARDEEDKWKTGGKEAVGEGGDRDAGGGDEMLWCGDLDEPNDADIKGMIEHLLHTNEDEWDDVFKDDKLFDDIDTTERRTVAMANRLDDVRVPREMGHWRKLEINAAGRRVVCNCEKCNFDGPRCPWVTMFQAIEFGVRPSDKVKGGGEATVGFENIVSQAAVALKHGNLRNVVE